MLSHMACPAPLGSPEVLPSPILPRLASGRPSLLRDAEQLASGSAGLQLCLSAADYVPADSSEGAQGLSAVLAFWLPGEHAEGGPG